MVREGIFLYDGVVECDIRIVYSSTRFGTGDDEDVDSIANDQIQATFYVQYGSTIRRGFFNAGSGGFSSLEDAVAYVVALPGIGTSVRWLPYA